jgi:hypothetical protein
MRVPSATRLVEAFRDLDRKGANLIRRIAHACGDRDRLAALIERACPETHAYARRCHSDPYDSHMWRVTMALHAIDRVLGTLGVEPLGPIAMREGPPYQYCDTGDAYAPTLIYTRATDTIRIGCWGDLVEAHPRRFRDRGDA